MRSGPMLATAGMFALYHGVVRPWQRYWGATPPEVARAMPGDALILGRGGDLFATQGISIDAPCDEIWPWLVQIGVGRAAFTL
jgi:hypothetical protein